MFWKKKYYEETIIIMTTDWYVGRPILDGGNKFYPVFEKYTYSNGFNFIPDRIVEYFSTTDEAEKYIEKRNGPKLENAAF